MHTKNPPSTGWRQPVQLSCCVLLASLLTGCVSTPTGDDARMPVPLTLNPYVYKPVEAPAKAYLEVAPVKDKRPVADGCVLVSQKDQNGRPLQGDYVTLEPFAEIFQDGLNTALEKNGFTTTNTTQYALEAEIADMDYEAGEAFSAPQNQPSVFSAFTTIHDITSTVTVNYALKNKTTGQLVWTNTYFGENKIETAWNNGLKIAQGCSLAAEDAIRQLIADQQFRGFFEIQATNAL